MTTTTTADKPRRRAKQLKTMAPATGEMLATVPIRTRAEVDGMVERARAAQPLWAGMSFAQRREVLLAWRREIARRADDFVQLIHKENGKTLGDATIEVMGTCSLIHFAANNAARVLSGKRSRAAGSMFTFKADVRYEALGVVGVIGPWNMPTLTPTGSIAFALAAGNAVVFKPSELTPLVGQLLAETAHAVFPSADIFHVATGDGSTGAALAAAAVDKIAFTGSTATGKRVMAAAAERLTPVALELGGKDPLIVAPDADVSAAARGAAFGAFSLAGQACISVERCYVDESVYDSFVEEVCKATERLRTGPEVDAHLGAMTRPQQIAIIREHVQDALDQGARAVVGGLQSIGERFIEPIVLVDVREDMKIMQEETFGPVLPILKVRDMDDAVRRANDTPYGLGSAVFGGKSARGLADRLRAGMTAINAVWAPVIIVSLPFGGVGESGFGRIHGEEGLKEFAREKATATLRPSIPAPPQFEFAKNPQAGASQVRGLIEKLYAGRTLDYVSDLKGKLTGR